MPRPQTKSELLHLSKLNFDKLNDFINSMEVEEQHKEFPPGTLNRNIRDVLMHLYEWHKMTLGWYKTGIDGGKPEIPAKGYTWKTMPELNKIIREKYSKTGLEEAKKHFKSSYEEIRKIIENLTDEQLFEKKRYKWTGTTSLGAYLVSATSSHYDWALKLIKRAKKVR
ncbi:ClbS/DfsB family four-helix bundle protein [Lunatibacter salilacus]|uniref:ClbS/DfsB family four-helix bundle protein n=1 Tax=Lunatibacter salilacus TaxID=2483804 RepID=UPI00131B7878|nr:ClbS/DfsB family four-helix bundle protein [Lunatibacter salilacus]